METKKRRKKYERRTPESYHEEVRNLTDGEYSVLEEFKNTAIKIKHVHNVCKTEWEVRPGDFVSRGIRCPNCRGTWTKRSPEEYSQEVKVETSGEYSVLEPYKNNKTKITHVHNVCGHEWKVNPKNFLQKGSRCPKCALMNIVRKTNEQFLAEVRGLVGDEYTFLEPYTKSFIEINIRHNLCGGVYKVMPTNFIQGSRCLHCAGKYRMSDEEFKQRIYDLVGGEYVFLEPFVTTHHPLKVVHKVCGYMYEVSPSTFIHRGSRCSNCAIEEKLENFKKRVYDLVGDEYTFLEPYKDNASKLEVRHAVCGEVYTVSPGNFFSGTRCPNCVYSRGEKAVADVLDSLSIEYSREHTFEYLGRKRYDFFIPSLNIAIEYDGEQHFKAVDHWGGEEALKRTQESDALKNDFCDFMGIDLLRIPYWEFDNIDEIVTNFIDTTKLMRSISANSSEMAKCR